MPDGAEPRVRGRGHALPFSKGRMATTLFLSGVEAEHAYQLALEIEREVLEVGASEILLDDLHGIVEGVLEASDGPPGVTRYRAWQAVLRRERPVILLIGGATGTGKSTLATELAYRVGISRITSTDVIRQVMRAFFAPELMPALHFSSFEAGGAMKMPMPDPDQGDRALYGFMQQAEQVAVGATAVVGRAVLEGLSTVLEGVHLVPGLVEAPPRHGATIVNVMLAIEDEEAHQSHFVARDSASGGARALERYLQHFGEIRRIQDYLMTRAHDMGVPVVDATDGEAALRSVLDLILERAMAEPGAVPSP
jgi:2-phosphoglycerate kinase